MSAPGNTLYTFRERGYWLVFILAIAIFCLFTFSPNGKYLWLVGFGLAYLCVRGFRIVKGYSDYLELDKPFAFKKIKIEYKDFTRIREQPAALKNPSALVFYYKDKIKERKIGFTASDGLIIKKALLEYNPQIRITESFDD
jgi:hypothetical protein